jgi:hypothetical protein
MLFLKVVNSPHGVRPRCISCENQVAWPRKGLYANRFGSGEAIKNNPGKTSSEHAWMVVVDCLSILNYLPGGYFSGA